MAVYSYLIEHDLGLAPNPFGKYCTLAVCKPKIRKSGALNIGDWVVGTGSKALEESTSRKLRGKLIYAMKVSEIITLDEYWHDRRFDYKKPIMNGPLVTMFGDNFYHKNDMNKWVQEDSAHCNLDGKENYEHLQLDITGKNVLIAEEFYYFGNQSPQIPAQLIGICHTTQGEKKFKNQLSIDFIHWIEVSFHKGIHGDPISWDEYNQLSLF